VARHPASGASGEFLFWFGDLERGVCSSIGHRDRGFESLKVARHPASVASGWNFGSLGDFVFCGEMASGELVVLFGGLERGVCSSIGHRDRGFGSLKWLGILPRWLRGSCGFVWGIRARGLLIHRSS